MYAHQHFNRLQQIKHIIKKDMKQPKASFEVKAAGFSHIFNSQASAKLRLFWCLLCIIIMGLFFKQCYERIDYFLSGVPSVNTEFWYNGSLIFPHIIVCPITIIQSHPAIWPPLLKNGFGNASYSDVYDLMNNKNINISTLWNISRLEVDEVKTLLFQHFSIVSGISFNTSSILMNKLETVLGTCWMFNITGPVPYSGVNTCLGVQAWTSENITWADSYRVAYVPAENLPLMKYTIAFGAHYMFFYQLVLNNLRVQLNIYRNTLKRPCLSKQEYIDCVVSCIEKNIFSKVLVPCRLPFMKTSSLRWCESSDEFKAVYDATDQVLTDFIHGKTTCTCPKKCEDVLYKLDAYRSMGKYTSLVAFLICFETNEVEVIKEDYMYDFWALLSDIGGSLGMFLGICALEIFEIISSFCSRC